MTLMILGYMLSLMSYEHIKSVSLTFHLVSDNIGTPGKPYMEDLLLVQDLVRW